MSGLYYLVMFAFWGFVSLIIAILLSAILNRLARRRGKSGRQVVFCTVSPFAGLLWLALAFLLHIKLSNDFAHQDAGFSGDPYVTLPNGYRLESGNTYDNRLIAPGFHSDMPIAGPGYVRMIVHLQVVEDGFIGDQYDPVTQSMRSFHFDTQTRQFQTQGSTPTADEMLHLKTHKRDLDMFSINQEQALHDPNGFWALYSKYRRTWPAIVLITVLMLGEGALVFVTKVTLD
jgi:hypothetical protein